MTDQLTRGADFVPDNPAVALWLDALTASRALKHDTRGEDVVKLLGHALDATGFALVRTKTPEQIHDLATCERRLKARPGYSPFHGTPAVFVCDCGRRFEFGDDEAEGGSWTLVTPATSPEEANGSPMLTPDAIAAALRALWPRDLWPAAYAEREDVAGRLDRDLRAGLAAFLAAQNRDALAATIAQAWLGDRYVGEATPAEWDAAYRATDALLASAPAPAQPV